jgi:hypothetical protein
VDFQYKELSELKPRKQDENIKIILDGSRAVNHYRELCRLASEAQLLSEKQVQYLEDRFWGWCWYAHTKIRRSELWEARGMLEYLRGNVLIPLSHSEGQVLEGSRRLETKLSEDIQKILAVTVSHEHSDVEYGRLLIAMMQTYIDLFDKLSPQLRKKVTKVNRDYFKQSINKV